MKKLFAAVSAAVMLFGAVSGFTACGKEEDEHAHIWNEGEITLAATCTQTGVKTFLCTVEGCTESYEESVEKIAHDFTGEWAGDENGHARKCVNCGTVNSESESHNFEEDTERYVAATCNSDGERVYVCRDCGAEKTEKVTERPAHDFTGEWAGDENGHARKCVNCGTVNSESESHNFEEDTERYVAATCNSDGERVYVCRDCGAEKTEKVTERPAHDFTGEWAGDENGHARKCVNCGTIDEKNTHNFTYTDIGADGHKEVCTDCGYGSALSAHEFGEGKVITQATFNKKGEAEYSCVCGHTKTEATDYAAANYGEQFTVSPDENHAWSYGKADYVWSPAENFTFTAATDTTDDAWKIGNSEIKAGWINADNNVAIGYKIPEGVTKIKFDLSYTGGGEDPGKFDIRIWRMAPDGTLQGNSIFIGKNPDGGKVENSGVIETNAGETVYLIFFHEGGWSQVDNFYYSLTNITPEALPEE